MLSDIPTPGPVYYKPYHSEDSTVHPRTKRDAKNLNFGPFHSKFSFFSDSFPSYSQHYEPVSAKSFSPYPEHYEPVRGTSPDQQHANNGYIHNVRFDDAPEPVYGIAFRVRRIYDCNDPGQDRGELESEGKVVECNIPRFRSVLPTNISQC